MTTYEVVCTRCGHQRNLSESFAKLLRRALDRERRPLSCWCPACNPEGKYMVQPPHQRHILRSENTEEINGLEEYLLLP